MSQPRTLEGKVAIVTGGSRGIGATIAFDLASRGAKVAITYTSESSKELVQKLIARIESEAKSSAIGIQSNARDDDSATKVVNETVKAFGPHVDILVNNAGVLSQQPLGKITAQEFNDVFAVNVRAPVMQIQALLPHLRRPGRIINISSIASRAGFPGTSVYGATKAALEAFTRSFASELGEGGTTCNTVNPGPVWTDMLASLPKDAVKGQTDMTPVESRAGRMEEIAEIVGFLAEPRSSWVTGQCISASGGFQMY